MKIHFTRTGLISLLLLTSACSGKFSASSSAMHSSLQTLALNAGTCGSDSVSIDGACYPLQTMDISSTGALPANKPSYLKVLRLPAESVGFMGISGTIALDLDMDKAFGEMLLEIGYADKCKPGLFNISGYDDVSKYLKNPNYMSADIIKINGVAHTEIPLDYTLRRPIKTGGCFFVLFGADTWQPTGAQAPNLTMTNTLTLKYITGPDSLYQAGFQLNEALGGGGEFCVGFCDKDFMRAVATPSTTYETVSQFPTDQMLRSLKGSISNAPFSADGRFAPVSGQWSTEDTFYLDPQCATSTPAFAGAVANGTTAPAGANVVLDVSLSGDGPNSVGQEAINKPVNVLVHAGDCLVHIFSANSNGVIDMETQIAAVVSNPVSPVSISLRSQSGFYVSAAKGGGGRLTVDQSVAAGWETFSLTNLSSQSLTDGDVIDLAAANGQFVSAQCGGGTDPNNQACGKVVANRVDAEGWEMFKLKKIGGSSGSAIVSGDQVALQSASGSFCSADASADGSGGGGGSGSVVTCNRATAQSWETFTISW